MLLILGAAAIAALPSLAFAQSGDLTCNTAQASYELVEQEGASPEALLTFRGSETVTGLAGTITTGAGANLPFDVAVSNGYATTSAVIPLGNGETISPPILSFGEGMVGAPLRPNEQAPLFLVFANAGRDAYYAQMQAADSDIVMPPETAWRLAFCRS